MMPTLSVSSHADIPFVDLSRANDPIRAELEAVFRQALQSGDFTLGRELEAFENDYAGYLGVAHAVGVGSGTAALAIALRATGIGPGDEVIVPAHTYIASAFPVLHAGARPVLCDVDRGSGLIDLDSAGSVVGEGTAAVMPVHLYGQACDMDAVVEFADRHGLAVIEDASQAHGARWAGRSAGSFGTVSAFSFYPSKNLGALGDGGMICTDDAEVAAAARRFRNLGQRDKGEHLVVGWNERLHTIQAAFLRVKLPYLDAWNQARREAAGVYERELPDEVARLPDRSGAEDVFHIYPVRVGARDTVVQTLSAAGIGTAVHYSPALHRQPALKGIVEPREHPNAERWAAEELSLPMFPGIQASEVSRVCEAVAQASSQVEVAG